MRETIDNAPKNGDFVRYIEQLEKEQFRNVAVMMERAQTRGPGEVKATTRANSASAKKPVQTTGPAAKLTAAQAQKVAEMLSKSSTPSADSTRLNPLAQRFMNRAGTFIAIVIGVIVFSKLANIPVWIAVPVVLGIWASYIKKSKDKTA